MINKLEMKAIKLAQFKSQETYCYEANVYLDGKPFAIVGNDGHGGCDYQHEHPKFKGEFYPTLKKLNAEFEKLPNIHQCLCVYRTTCSIRITHTTYL